MPKIGVDLYKQDRTEGIECAHEHITQEIDGRAQQVAGKKLRDQNSGLQHRDSTPIAPCTQSAHFCQHWSEHQKSRDGLALAARSQTCAFYNITMSFL